MMKHVVTKANNWTEDDERHALRQGYSLFTVDSADVVIQKVDDPPAHHLWEEGMAEDELFSSDTAAIRFVRNAAAVGDKTAKKAIVVHDANYAHWRRWCRLHPNG